MVSGSRVEGLTIWAWGSKGLEGLDPARVEGKAP